MTEYSSLAEAISENNQEPSWLKEYRLAALSAFAAASAPNRNDEAWRRTDVSRFLMSNVEPEAQKAASSCDAKIWIPGSDSSDIGARFTSAENEGVVFTTIADAARKVPDIVRKFLAADEFKTYAKLELLAHALWNGGIFLYVPHNAKIDLPLSAFVNSAAKDHFQKILIVVEQGASANFWIDQASDAARRIGAVTRVYLREGANLSMLSVQRHFHQANLFSDFNADLERDAHLNMITVEAGSAMAKENWTVRLSGENASAKVFGLVRAAGKQHFDETLYVSHQKPRTQSEVLFKTVAAGESRSIFSGLIHVGKEAQKTVAYQTNRNLLLSRQARTDTIPKLEIEADDVKCGHGAAVSSIDEEQIYYLMSRGLDRELAKEVIIEGFYSDVLGRWMMDDTLAARVREQFHSEVSQSMREILVGKGALYEEAVA